MHVTPREYMTGFCHVFALAAHRRTGWSMMAAMKGARKGEETFRGYGDIIHVFVVDKDGNRFDALGPGDSPEDYEEEMEARLGETVWMLDIEEADVAELARMGWLRLYDEDDLSRAAEDVLEVMAEEGMDIDLPQPTIAA